MDQLLKGSQVGRLGTRTVVNRARAGRIRAGPTSRGLTSLVEVEAREAALGLTQKQLLTHSRT